MNGRSPATAMPAGRIAYLINQYPKVSHTFIRREMQALEALGVAVQRFALRGWDAEVVDEDDVRERERTGYVLRGGAWPLVQALAAACLRSPSRFFAALRAAVRMSRRAPRGLAIHLVYLAEAAWLARRLRDAGIGHLHAHFGTNAAEVAMLTRLLGGPSYSFTVHGPEEFDAPQALHLAAKADRASFVVAISSFGRSQLQRWMPAPQWPKVRVVHCGLDDAFVAAPPSATPDVARFVCVGRLCEQKGQLLLLAALKIVHERGVRCRLVLAGDGEMRDEIEAHVAALGLQDAVVVTGWVDGERVRTEIAASRALVLPSFAEGLPIVLMEAMAMARPVISTYVAGIPELVRPDVDGWLVPAGDVNALADALEACLRMPAEAVTRMGQAARGRVLARHSGVVAAERLASHFRTATERAAAGSEAAR